MLTKPQEPVNHTGDLLVWLPLGAFQILSFAGKTYVVRPVAVAGRKRVKKNELCADLSLYEEENSVVGSRPLFGENPDFNFNRVRTHMKTFLTILAAFGILVLSVNAQQPVRIAVGDVDVKSMEVESQQTPEFQASGPKNKNIPSPRQWLEFEVEFEIDGPREQVVPELLFRYYIGMRDQDGQSLVLTGDVTHLNVLCGEESYSAVYVSPNTLGTLTGDYRRFQPSSVSAVGVEVYFNGVMVGGDSTLSGSNAKFWQALPTRPGILAKHETPFALLWLDRYADAKKD